MYRIDQDIKKVINWLNIKALLRLCILRPIYINLLYCTQRNTKDSRWYLNVGVENFWYSLAVKSYSRWQYIYEFVTSNFVRTELSSDCFLHSHSCLAVTDSVIWQAIFSGYILKLQPMTNAQKWRKMPDWKQFSREKDCFQSISLFIFRSSSCITVHGFIHYV